MGKKLANHNPWTPRGKQTFSGEIKEQLIQHSLLSLSDQLRVQKSTSAEDTSQILYHCASTATTLSKSHLPSDAVLWHCQIPSCSVVRTTSVPGKLHTVSTWLPWQWQLWEKRSQAYGDDQIRQKCIFCSQRWLPILSLLRSIFRQAMYRTRLRLPLTKTAGQSGSLS
jgi:hypothetical protein